MLVVILTTVFLFNNLNRPEIHSYQVKSPTVCAKQRDEWLAMTMWENAHAAPAFQATASASCKVYYVGAQPQHHV